MLKLIVVLSLLVFLSGCMSISLPHDCDIVIYYPNGEIAEMEIEEPITIVVPIGTVITVYPINGFSYNITGEEKARIF